MLGAWSKDTPSSSPEPGPDRSRGQQLCPPLCCHQRRRPIGAAFRRGEREGGKREPNRKDLVVSVGAGGGASSGALNFQALSCQSILAQQLPVPPSRHRKPTPVPGPHGVGWTVAPGERRVPGVGTTGRRRPRLTHRESSVLSAAKKAPPPSLAPFAGPGSPFAVLKSPLLRKHKARLGLRGRQIWFPSDQRHAAVNKIVSTWADNNKRQLYPAPILQRFGGFRDHRDTFSYLLPLPPPAP